MEPEMFYILVGFFCIFGIIYYATKPVEKQPEFDLTVCPGKKELQLLSKVELENLGRKYGIELDRRKSSKNMINDLQKLHKVKKYN